MDQVKTGPSSQADREAKGRSGDLSPRVQLKQQLAELTYEDQVAAVQPAGAAQSSTTSQQVQAESDNTVSSEFVKTAASAGLEGSGSSLPYLGQVQQSFGHHDVSSVQAHTGGKAAEASKAIGASAYASGNKVAFKSAPSLHTVAHEAAHVVQQRSGIQLSGGVGRPGDVYERHADAVANAVVGGKSAAPLLDGMVQARSEAAVQMVIDDTKIDGTEVYPDIAAKAKAKLEAQGVDTSSLRTIRDYMDAMDGNDATKREQYTKNSKLKVKFEEELAVALIQNDSEYRPTVESVSKNIYEYYRAKKALYKGTDKSTTIKAQVEQMVGMYGWLSDRDGNPFAVKELLYGRIDDVDLTDDAGIAKVTERISRILRDGGGSISNHIYAHHQFMDTIYGNDFYESGGFEDSVAQTILSSINTSFQAIEPKFLRTQAEGNPFGVLMDPATGKPVKIGGKFKEDGVTRGRTHKSDTAKESQRNAGGSSTQVGIGSGDSGGGSSSTGETNQAHGRGVDRYELDPTQKFIQEALVLHDMPLAAGVSGTTTDLLECARTFGLQNGTVQMFQYVLGCLNQLMGAGAHSFHEIMAAAQTVEVPYEDGNYRVILNMGVNSKVSQLFSKAEYSRIPGIGFDP